MLSMNVFDLSFGLLMNIVRCRCGFSAVILTPYPKCY